MHLPDLLKKNWPLIALGLSALTIVTLRVSQPVALNYDGMALAETAWRFSQGKGLTCSLFMEHPQDLAQPVRYEPMTWWAPLAPLTIGWLVKLGLSLHDSHAVYYAFWMSVLWAGWILLAGKFLMPWLRLHPWCGALVALSPWFFTPLRDVDEIVVSALVPWIALAVALISNRRAIIGGLCASLLGMGLVLFCNQGTGLWAITFFVVLLVSPSWLSRTLLAGILILSLFTATAIKATITELLPAYASLMPVGAWDFIKVAWTCAHIVGLAPLLAVTEFLLPEPMSEWFSQFHRKEIFPGLVTLLVFLAAFVWYFLKWKRGVSTLKSLDGCSLFLAAVVCLWPWFILGSDVIAGGQALLGKEESYYLLYLPTILFAVICVLSAQAPSRKLIFFNRLASVLTIYVAIFTVSGVLRETSRARVNIIGYSIQPNEWMRQNRWFLQAHPEDYDLSLLRDQPAGIIYTGGTTKAALLNEDLPHSIRPVPMRSYWRSVYASEPVTLYFVLEEGKAPKPLGMLKVLYKDKSEYSPPLRELFSLPGWRQLEGEVYFYRSEAFDKPSRRTMRVYRCDLPAGWKSNLSY